MKKIRTVIGLAAMCGTVVAFFVYTPWPLAVLMSIQIFLLWVAIGQTLGRVTDLQAWKTALEAASKVVVTEARRSDEPLH